MKKSLARVKSESSDSGGSEQSTPLNKKSGKHPSKRHHRSEHKSSKRDKRDESAEVKKEEPLAEGKGPEAEVRKKSRSRSASREKESKKAPDEQVKIETTK